MLPATHLSGRVLTSHSPFNCWTSSRKAVNTNFIVFGLTQPGMELESNDHFSFRHCWYARFPLLYAGAWRTISQLMWGSVRVFYISKYILIIRRRLYYVGVWMTVTIIVVGFELGFALSIVAYIKALLLFAIIYCCLLNEGFFPASIV